MPNKYSTVLGKIIAQLMLISCFSEIVYWMNYWSTSIFICVKWNERSISLDFWVRNRDGLFFKIFGKQWLFFFFSKPNWAIASVPSKVLHLIWEDSNRCLCGTHWTCFFLRQSLLSPETDVTFPQIANFLALVVYYTVLLS